MALRAAIPSLPERDRGFATSLCDQYDRRQNQMRPLSDKQMFWVRKLMERVRTDQAAAVQVPQDTLTAPAPPAAVQVGDMAGVIALFNQAATHLRRPKIVLRTERDTVRLFVAGPTANYPGTINVVSNIRTDSRGRKVWYGRIQPDGTFEPSRASEFYTSTSEVIETVRRFAANPAQVAAEHAHFTGRCCFCNLELTDDRSTAVGYGPICAAHFGLPWGEERTTGFDRQCEMRLNMSREETTALGIPLIRQRAATTRQEEEEFVRRASQYVPSRPLRVTRAPVPTFDDELGEDQ
jgi:hypothetical protein